jgi:hypothetical protein
VHEAETAYLRMMGNSSHSESMPQSSTSHALTVAQRARCQAEQLPVNPQEVAYLFKPRNGGIHGTSRKPGHRLDDLMGDLCVFAIQVGFGKNRV